MSATFLFPDERTQSFSIWTLSPQGPDDDDNDIVQVEVVFRDLFVFDEETRPSGLNSFMKAKKNNFIRIICLYINLLTLRLS